jgi:hypothetical protein
MEPWFDTVAAVALRGGHGSCGDSRVSRYSESTLENMWKCKFDSGAADVDCKQSGHNDPPYTHVEAMLEAQMASAGNDANKSIFIVLGDLQPHAFNSSCMEADFTQAVKAVAEKAVEMMKAKVNNDVSRIVIVPGNHDGPEDSLFVEGGDGNTSVAWADVLIDAGIVTNSLSQMKDPYLVDGTPTLPLDLFRQTGYYIKPVDSSANGDLGYGMKNSNCYFIVLNTNLGHNHTVQRKALRQDLEWVNAQAGCAYILGHNNVEFHLEDGTQEADLPLNSELEGRISGVLAGSDQRTQAATTDTEFTQVGGASPGNTKTDDVMFYVTKVTQLNHALSITPELHGAMWSGVPNTLPSVSDWYKLPGQPVPDSPAPSPRPYIPTG